MREFDIVNEANMGQKVLSDVMSNPENTKKACDAIFKEMKKYSNNHYTHGHNLVSDTMKDNIHLYKGFGIKKFLLLLKQRGFLSPQDTKKIYKKPLDIKIKPAILILWIGK
jgi:hypothetical protein